MIYRGIVSKELIPNLVREDLEFISQKVKSVGKEAYLIGGAVRDLVMGKTPHEFDITTSLLPKEVKNLFKKVIETGIQHGTVLVLLKNGNYEFTTYRTEKGYSDGRRPDQVEFSASLEEDLKRRDFTMNALAMDLEDFSVIDYQNGIQDIQKKMIRTIGNPIERFTEDGLRPIRAIRFMSSLGFAMEEETYKSIFLTRGITSKISRERFHDELIKILKTSKPSIALHELKRNQIFSLFVSNVKEGESDFLDSIDSLVLNPLGLRLAGVLYDLTKGSQELEQSAKVILKDLKFSKENIKDTLYYLQWFVQMENLKELTAFSVRKYLSDLYKNFPSQRREEILNGILSFLENFKGNFFRREFESFTKEIQNQKNPLLLSDLVIDGNRISQRFPLIEKKKYGEVLQNCLELVLKQPDCNQEEILYQHIGRYYIL
jgi:tRNA nucleotidyltransferase/poly(A) polymerase